MASQSTPRITPQEYLAMEAEAEGRSEYLDGVVYAMAGGSPQHSSIAANLVATIHQQLRGGDCRVFGSDMRVAVPPRSSYVYPDVSVVCGKPIMERPGDSLLNPVLVVEVLSPSTEAYDPGRKFGLYRALPTLAHYLLVAQDRMHIEYWARRPSGDWSVTESEEPSGSVALGAIQVSLSLEQVYEGIELSG